MIPDQEKQFNLYGCVSRSIIKVTEIRNVPISKADFITRYSHLFDPKYYGSLSVDGFCEVVKDLGLAKVVYAIRNIELAKQYLLSGLTSNLFVMTDTIANQPDPLYHCRLAMDYEERIHDTSKPHLLEASLHLYSPSQNGSDHDLWVSLSRLESELVHFLLIR